ncbi:MAG TPA: hypothetical protein PLO59_00065 [Bacteroidia bacterium]|nr:hypothetical protein [Bacteroidia bacterium]
MKKNQHPPAPTFKQWYVSLNRAQQAGAKARIQNECALRGNTIFNNWLYSYTGIAPIYQPIIEKIAGCKIDFTFTPSPSSYHAKKTVSNGN